MAVIDNLIAYYSLDEGSGNAIDAHGSNDLTDTNTVGASATAKQGTSRDFATGAPGDYFNLADNADMGLGSDDAFTWAGWARNRTDFQSGTVVFGKWSSGGGNDGAYSLYIKGANFRYTFAIANGSSVTEVSDTTVFPTPAETWAFIVCWHDPSADKIFIQVNNDATPDEAAWSGGTHSSETNPFRLGHDSGAYGGSWDGLLDEWGFWKRVLTSDERTWLYNSGSGRSYANIVAESGRTTKNTRAFPLGINVGMGFGIGGA
jgi:hypothetical protein